MEVLMLVKHQIRILLRVPIFLVLCVAIVLQFLCIPASSQTSKQITAADPRVTYEFFKKKEMEHFRPWRKQDLIDGKLDLAICVAGQVRHGPADSLLLSLLDHATYVVALRERLALYPLPVWEKEMTDFETGVLTKIADGRQKALRSNESAFAESLAKKLNQYRQSHPQYPEVWLDGGCGDGETAVEIVTRPRAKRIQYLSVYYYLLCKEQNLDPLDTSSCDRWTDLGSKDALFAGRYKVLVTWQNGAPQTVRDLDVDSLKPRGEIDINAPEKAIRFIIKQ
jgi:hypothetical protein